MPFYSRHSSDGRDRFLGDIHDEEDYDQFMKMIFISSNFTDEIHSHYDSSEADVLPPSRSEEEMIETTRKYQREYHRKYYKEKQQQPYMCRICGKTLSDSSNLKSHEKSKRCTIARKRLVKIVILNTQGFQIPFEVRCFRYVFGVQIPPHKVFGSLGILI